MDKIFSSKVALNPLSRCSFLWIISNIRGSWESMGLVAFGQETMNWLNVCPLDLLSGLVELGWVALRFLE